MSPFTEFVPSSYIKDCQSQSEKGSPMPEKLPNTSIIQIISHDTSKSSQTSNIVGLGSDGQIYTWHWKDATWVLFASGSNTGGY